MNPIKLEEREDQKFSLGALFILRADWMLMEFILNWTLSFHQVSPKIAVDTYHFVSINSLEIKLIEMNEFYWSMKPFFSFPRPIVEYQHYKSLTMQRSTKTNLSEPPLTSLVMAPAKVHCNHTEWVRGHLRGHRGTDRQFPHASYVSLWSYSDFLFTFLLSWWHNRCFLTTNLQVLTT